MAGTYGASKEIDASRALRVAVAGTIRSTSLVQVRKTTGRVHFGEVERTVIPTREVGNVDVECEFLVENVEVFVLSLGVEEVYPGATIPKVNANSVTSGRHAIGTAVICAVYSTVLSAGGSVGAEGGIKACRVTRFTAVEMVKQSP